MKKIDLEAHFYTEEYNEYFHKRNGFPKLETIEDEKHRNIGMFFEPVFLCVYSALGADNIAFAVDYPFADNKLAVQFMERMPIGDKDKEKICHLNAEKLFKTRRKI